MFVVRMRLTTVFTAALSPRSKALGFLLALVLPLLLTRAAAALRALLLREGGIALFLLDSRNLLGGRLPLVLRLFPGGG